MCKLSIIIPVFNKEKYLADTLNAILKCKSIDYELIIVNDGSTDGSCQIIEEFQNKNNRIKHVDLVNGGVSRARNEGLKIAQGEWIWFIDADDTPCMVFAESFMQIEYKSFDLYCGDFVNVSNEKKELIHNVESENILSRELLYKSFFEMQFRNGYYGYLWNKIIKRNLIFDNQLIFDESLRLAEDLDFMIKLYAKCNSIKITSDIAMYYRTEADNNSSQKRIDYYSQLRIQLSIKQWFQKSVNYIEYENELNINITRYAAYILFYAAENKENIYKIAKDLGNDKGIAESLVYWSDSSVMGKISRLLLQEKYWSLCAYLYLRKIMRSIYRTILKRK